MPKPSTQNANNKRDCSGGGPQGPNNNNSNNKKNKQQQHEPTPKNAGVTLQRKLGDFVGEVQELNARVARADNEVKLARSETDAAKKGLAKEKQTSTALQAKVQQLEAQLKSQLKAASEQQNKSRQEYKAELTRMCQAQNKNMEKKANRVLVLEEEVEKLKAKHASALKEQEMMKEKLSHELKEKLTKEFQEKLAKEVEEAIKCKEANPAVVGLDHPEGEDSQVIDGEFRARWLSIDAIIEQITNKCIDKSIAEVPIHQVNDPWLFVLVDELKKYPHLEPYMIQRFLWHRVCLDVFQAKGGFWGGNDDEHFQNMLDNMPDIKRGVPGSATQSIGQAIDAIREVYTDLLEKAGRAFFSDMSALADPPNHERLQAMLWLLYHEAAELMLLMAKSQPLFIIDSDCLGPRDGPSLFEPTAMQIVFVAGENPSEPRGEQLTVDFLVTPAVERIGTGEAGRLDCRLQLFKSGAVVHWEESAESLSLQGVEEAHEG
ncbi:hypothetical protein HIM_04053 [Hirsutella minnesotensis 3608]|uniref:Uncharacterized protein n=1 Tax=Hirsutella minnesotensis 3608 TaxID=1043627 RepID=A0A0F8A248_9HYPO|nr:hypothetical protein HIM_04053 [Hirsutella minnesotensis 3608]